MRLVKLEHNIYKIVEFLSVEECDSLIELSESQGFTSADVQTNAGRRMLNNIRNNQRVDYQSNELATDYWHRLRDLGLPLHENKSAIGLSPHFRFYKYQPGEKFNMHKDGRQLVNGNETLFTFMVYLNEGCAGGETLFRLNDRKIMPRKGMAIIFEHELWHKGVEVEGGVKYVLRTDIVYAQNLAH